VAQLRLRHPKVQVELHQGTPDQVARMLIDETAVIGLATEALDQHDELLTLPCYEWQHVVVVPPDHPLAASERLTLESLARHPLVSYHPSVAGRSRIDAAFARAGLRPTLALEALDSDVIKTYTRVGLGVGIVAEMAVREDTPDGGLIALPAGHLFGTNVSRIAFRKGVYLRQFVLTFASLLSDRLSPDLLRRLTAQGTKASDL
jgi:LysR family cys regulon transcriptional activator